jgi:hypothetical protein
VPRVPEDWRLTVTLQADGHAGRLIGRLQSHEVEDDVREQLGDRVAVSRGGNHVFLYADAESAARQAEQVVRQVLSEQKMSGEFELERWHHLEEKWEPASVPLPTTAAARRAEHEQLEEQEAAESQQSGLAEWEVRIELPSHRAASALAEQLDRQGQSIVRRWKYLIVGANNEDDADTLAQRLKAAAPPEAVIHVEPGGGIAWQALARNPFAVFGGLGG